MYIMKVIKNFECEESSAPVCLLLFYQYQVKVSQEDTSCNLEMYSLISVLNKYVELCLFVIIHILFGKDAVANSC